MIIYFKIPNLITLVATFYASRITFDSCFSFASTTMISCLCFRCKLTQTLLKLSLIRQIFKLLASRYTEIGNTRSCHRNFIRSSLIPSIIKLNLYRSQRYIHIHIFILLMNDNFSKTYSYKPWLFLDTQASIYFL